MADEPTVVDVDVSDEDLFNEARANEPAAVPETAVAAESETPAPEPGDQPRDEHGRFAPKAGDSPAPAEATPPAVQQPPEADGGHIPAWRLREEAENRRAAEARAQQFERELAELRRNPPKPAEPPKPEVKPDPLLDPEGYEAYLERKVEAKFIARDERAARERGEESFQAARASNPELFDKAYAEAQRNMDAVLNQRILQSRDPGKELLSWYRQRETVREVGDDPNAWFDRKFEEALKDPARAAKAISILRAQQQQPLTSTNGSRQPSPVRLPPSLHGITPSGAAPAGDDDTDMSDEAIFRHATAGPRR